MGRHRFDDKDQDSWGGPELAEKRGNSTRHNRDTDRDSGTTAPEQQPSRRVAGEAEQVEKLLLGW